MDGWMDRGGWMTYPFCSFGLWSRGIEFLMYRGLIGKRALAGFGVTSICLGIWLHGIHERKEERNASRFFTSLRRNTRTVITAGKILSNYWWATRKRKAKDHHHHSGGELERERGKFCINMLPSNF